MKNVLKKIAVLTAGILTACCLSVNADEIVDSQARNVHDPSIIRSSEYFYVYSTGTTLSMRRSRNLHNWESLGSVLPAIPAWVQTKISGITNLWAPDPIYHNGRYYLNYSGSTFGSNTSTIGLLSNLTLDPASPDYNWVDEGEIVSSTSANNYNAIDGAFVRDSSGGMWMCFGSFWPGGIQLTPLNPATMKPTTTPASLYTIARRLTAPYAMEASYIVYRNGYYYLFVNYDTCCKGVDSTYKIMVGRAAAITGPYYDKSGVSMYNGGGTLFLGTADRWIGPGHASVVNVDGQDFFSFHAYDGLSNGTPTLRVHELFWDQDLWPVLGDAIVPATGGTVGYWNFDNGTPGTPMNNTGLTGQIGTVDLSGNDFHMYAWDATSGPSFSLEGQTPTGEGLSSRHNGGQDGYTKDAYINNWSAASWTIELAVKLDTLTGWQTMIGRDGSAQGEAESDFYFQKQDTSDTFRINFDTVGGQRYILDANFTVTAGQWYYLAAVSDGTTLTLYADKLDGNGYGIVGSLAMNTANNNAFASGSDNWTFGRGWFNGSFVDHITGNLDDIRFTDKALAPTEFLHYNALTVIETDGSTQVSEQGPSSDTYFIRLNHHTTWPALAGNVIVTLSADDQISVEPDQIIFTPADWQTDRLITVTALDDDVLEDDPHTGRIQSTLTSTDTRYQNAPAADFMVNIVENDCGAWGYLAWDLNLDCFVDMRDFALFASTWVDSIDDVLGFSGDWLKTTQPFGPGAVVP